MSTYKTLVIGIDLKGGHEQVLSKAADLMKCHDARVILVHVDHLPVPPNAGSYADDPSGSNDNHFDPNDSRKKLLSELEALAKKHGLPADCARVEFGRPVDMILAVAEKEAADLIVVGSHGRHGIRLLLGSTANAVLHHAKRDVLAVRLQK